MIGDGACKDRGKAQHLFSSLFSGPFHAHFSLLQCIQNCSYITQHLDDPGAEDRKLKGTIGVESSFQHKCCRILNDDES